MSDADNKCFGCGVRLNVGAHTFKLDDKEWHCACLLRSQEGEVRVLNERYDEHRAQRAALTTALAEVLDLVESICFNSDAAVPPRNAELRAKFLGKR